MLLNFAKFKRERYEREFDRIFNQEDVNMAAKNPKKKKPSQKKAVKNGRVTPKKKAPKKVAPKVAPGCEEEPVDDGVFEELVHEFDDTDYSDEEY